jgi:hypothetical protein
MSATSNQNESELSNDPAFNVMVNDVEYSNINSIFITRVPSHDGSIRQLYVHTSGAFFVRARRGSDDELTLLDRSRAFERIAEAQRRITDELLREKLENGLQSTINGKNYNTNVTEQINSCCAWHNGDDGEAVALYTNGEEAFLHIVYEYDQEWVCIIDDDDVELVSHSIDFWQFTPTFLEFLTFMDRMGVEFSSAGRFKLEHPIAPLPLKASDVDR